MYIFQPLSRHMRYAPAVHRQFHKYTIYAYTGIISNEIIRGACICTHRIVQVLCDVMCVGQKYSIRARVYRGEQGILYREKTLVNARPTNK